MTENLITALAVCAAPQNAAAAAKQLLNALGYDSERVVDVEFDGADFIKQYPAPKGGTKSENYLKEKAESLHIVFQYAEEDLQRGLLKGEKEFNQGNNRSFLFVAVNLRQETYQRGNYAKLTREINKRFSMPTVVLFFHAEHLTMSFAGRRISRADAARDVLENVSMLREINCENPHPGHIAILKELSRDKRQKWLNNNKKEENFDGLLAAWLNELNTEALNQRFYDELCKWFDRAVQQAQFPMQKAATLDAPDVKPEEEQKNLHIIRLLSRVLFIWFIKEKGLVEEKLFEEKQVMPLLTDAARNQGDNYYRVVLQNLFFATLNTKIKEREFRKEDEKPNPNYPQHTQFNSYRNHKFRRYEKMLSNPKKLTEWLDKSPFVNGGLFECLDPHETGNNHVDCFTDNAKFQKRLSVRDALFFDEEKETKGLFTILRKYKFTVEENTPIEQEVALDPELLGKVFENLLVYVKRKQTGSYYTPRAIVDYMVRESLLAHFRRAMPKAKGDALRNLLTEEIDYDQTADKLTKEEVQAFMNAAENLRLFDPAVGSGAFPMGVLQKMVLALKRLDPTNERLKAREMERADSFDIEKDASDARAMVEKNFSAENSHNDYGRKLLLIRDNIFGADIQPTAVQICRLRFFISLAIEQTTNDDKGDNYGIDALPNLETKILAADTLLRLAPADLFRDAEDIKKLEEEIKSIRKKFFSATDREIKKKHRNQDKKKRGELAKLLRRKNYPPGDADKIAEWDLYAHDSVADWFSAEWMFGVKNFDIVIGNPPYVQLQKDGGQLANRYAPQQYKTFARMGDVYCIFYERGLQLCAPDGHLCYITSNKWMRAGYGEKTRKFFLQKNPLRLIDLGSGMFEATVDTNILLLQNAVNKNALRAITLVKKGQEYPTVESITEQMERNDMPLDTAALLTGDPWFIGNADEVALKNKIEQNGTPLKDWDISINYGIKTGYNEAYIIDENKRKELLDACKNETERKRTNAILRPMLRGRDIKCYRSEWAGLYLMFIPWHFPLHKESGIQGASLKAEESLKNEYPAIYKHLLLYKEQLSKRNKDETGIRYEWYALQRCANTYYSEFDKEKIVQPQTVKKQSFTLDKNNFYGDVTMQFWVSANDDIKYLLAIANSKVFNFYMRRIAYAYGEKGTRWIPAFLLEVPVPKITPENEKTAGKIEELAEKILAEKATDAAANTSALEAEVDELVYNLYNLTTEEIALIEGKGKP